MPITACWAIRWSVASRWCQHGRRRPCRARGLRRRPRPGASVGASSCDEPVDGQNDDGSDYGGDPGGEMEEAFDRVHAEDDLPSQPPRRPLTMPISIVIRQPPGSLPGINALAIAPASRPIRIHAMMLIHTHLSPKRRCSSSFVPHFGHTERLATPVGQLPASVSGCPASFQRAGGC